MSEKNLLNSKARISSECDCVYSAVGNMRSVAAAVEKMFSLDNLPTTNVNIFVVIKNISLLKCIIPPEVLQNVHIFA